MDPSQQNRTTLLFLIIEINLYYVIANINKIQSISTSISPYLGTHPI